MELAEKAFHEVLLSLGQENLDNLIIVGGWCPYLYAEYVWKRNLPFPKTQDIDFAVKNMTPDRFSEPVYRRLVKAHLVPRKIDVDNTNRTQFIYVDGTFSVPIEFVTSTSVLPRGQKPRNVPYVACDPLDELSFALKIPPLKEKLSYKGKTLHIQVMSPTAFVVVKGLLIEHRSNSVKIDKDLASIAFVLRYAPDREAIIDELKAFSSDEAVKEFRTIMRNLFRKPGERAMRMLEPAYQSWEVPRAKISEEIEASFGALLSL